MYLSQKKNTILIKVLALVLCIGIFCTGCVSNNSQNDNAILYKSISVNDAVALMDSEQEYILLDVRTEQEYLSGYIPGAICIPNEDIDETIVDLLPDKAQKIFVYCRSGNRSKQAAEKLANLGYTNIIEIGGVKDWTGDLIVAGEK